MIAAPEGCAYTHPAARRLRARSWPRPEEGGQGQGFAALHASTGKGIRLQISVTFFHSPTPMGADPAAQLGELLGWTLAQTEGAWKGLLVAARAGRGGAGADLAGHLGEPVAPRAERLRWRPSKREHHLARARAL